METALAIKKRRAVNFFDPNFKMSDDDIRQLLDTAALAPSSYNLQPWEVIVVRSPERKKALRECAFNQPKVEEASAVIIVIADTDSIEMQVDKVFSDFAAKGYTDEKGAAGLKDVVSSFYGTSDSERRRLFAVRNSSLFAMNFMLIAESEGYSTHPMDGFSEDKIKEVFGISNDKVIPMIIAVGKPKPDLQLYPPKKRFSASEFAKFE